MKGRGIKGEGLLNNLLLREGGQGDRLLNDLMILLKKRQNLIVILEHMCYYERVHIEGGRI